MIVLENDDKIYGVKDVLAVCEKLHIPMVLDYHHFKCHNEGENIRVYHRKCIFLPQKINENKEAIVNI